MSCSTQDLILKKHQPPCLKKLKLLFSWKNAIKEEHAASVRCHNLVSAKVSCYSNENIV